MSSQKDFVHLETEGIELPNETGVLGLQISEEDDYLLSQAYDYFIQQPLNNPVEIISKKEECLNIVLNEPETKGKKYKKSNRNNLGDNNILLLSEECKISETNTIYHCQPGTSKQMQPETMDDSFKSAVISAETLNSREIEKREGSGEFDIESLYGGDFSDNDPTYHPENQQAPPSDSDDSELINLEELLNPDLVYTAEKNKNIQRRKCIHMLFGNKSESRQIAELVMFDIFEHSWKILKPQSRWRQLDPASWKVNVAKKRRAEGLSYVTGKKVRNPKVPTIVDCSKCKYQCSNNFTESVRQTLCRLYWSLDFVGRKAFLLKHVSVMPTKRLLKDRKRITERSFTKKCFFVVEGQQKYVCSRFFCSTLSISPFTVNNAIKRTDPFGCYLEDKDPRGRQEAPNKTPPEKIEEIKSHIASFPTMESHYTRKQSTRKYLSAGFSLAKMYSLYVNQCEERNTKPVSEITYRRIFSREFNLSFFVPKKDQCLLCTKYNRANADEKTNLAQNYEDHIKRKQACNTEKAKDKERAEKELNFLSATFDLQAILQIPSTKVGLLYYTRKLTVYNLTLYESALPNEAYCFVWTEVHGKKGSSEVGTILAHYLTNCIPENVTEVSLFSDTCGGQNRNQFIAALLLWVINQSKQLQIIEHKFLESGHSYMEADSMHSSIESAKKHRDVYCLSDWINIFKDARSKGTYKKGTKKVKKNKYNVKQFTYSEFKDLKQLASTIILNKTTNTEGQRIQWLKIKRMKYIKGDRNIHYNYDMSTSFKTMNVTCSGAQPNTSATTVSESHGYATRRKSEHQDVCEPATSSTSCEFIFPSLHQLYNKPLPITVAKKKDLLNLCEKGVIPEEYHGWFQSLATDNRTIDRLPEAAISEESDLSDNE
ncbi:unnamed protein product [Parnassius mnemosyne]|uniref:DUF7869 domain-containing protein n=1 Tax=Parnassius mnemosyne TaxID=213953 RepID=A0AAV1KZZ0_9NEOP